MLLLWSSNRQLCTHTHMHTRRMLAPVTRDMCVFHLHMLPLPLHRPFAGASGAVALCINCPSPSPVLSAPSLVTKPCAGSSASDFTPVRFDAGASVASPAAPITAVTWELIGGSSQSISAAIDALAARSDVRCVNLVHPYALATPTPPSLMMMIDNEQDEDTPCWYAC
jgi:hypothetical protein